MELTSSFLDLLQHFAPVFTAPTYQTFLVIVAGWVLSQRHRFITEVIFSGGHVGKGHWSRFHRFFSHAAWDIDTFSMALAKMVVTILAPGAELLWAVDDTLCRKRGLTLYGAGMHYDPLISSRPKALVSWGHDWVVLCLIVVHPFWAPTKVFALPIAARLYINRQGLTKGKKGKAKAAQSEKGKAKKAKATAQAKANPDHRTRPELALGLIHLVARWFPDDEIIVLGDSAYGGRSVLSHLPPNVHLISRVHPEGALYKPAPPKAPRTPGRPRKKGDRLPGMAGWAADPTQPWSRLDFDQFGLHAALQVKTIRALYYKSGRDRLLTIVLVHDVEGKRPDQMFYCTKLDWTAGRCSRRTPVAGRSNAHSNTASNSSGWRTRPIVSPRRSSGRLRWRCLSTPSWWCGSTAGHRSVQFPFRPWYRKKAEPSFADMLTTLRRLSYDEKTEGLLPEHTRLKTWIAQLTELLSRTG